MHPEASFALQPRPHPFCLIVAISAFSLYDPSPLRYRSACAASAVHVGVHVHVHVHVHVQ